MNNYYDLLVKMSRYPNKDEGLVIKKKKIDELSENLIQAFIWKDTVEGFLFWDYVFTRINQLSNGIGYRNEDIED